MLDKCRGFTFPHTSVRREEYCHRVKEIELSQSLVSGVLDNNPIGSEVFSKVVTWPLTKWTHFFLQSAEKFALLTKDRLFITDFVIGRQMTCAECVRNVQRARLTYTSNGINFRCHNVNKYREPHRSEAITFSSDCHFTMQRHYDPKSNLCIAV